MDSVAAIYLANENDRAEVRVQNEPGKRHDDEIRQCWFGPYCC